MGACGPRSSSIGGTLGCGCGCCCCCCWPAGLGDCACCSCCACSMVPAASGRNLALNITMASPSIRLLDEVRVPADARLLPVFVRSLLVGHQLARVVLGIRLGLRDGSALGLRMGESVVDGG